MNKHGSYIAEAAIVLPFIILAVITCVLIVMDFYEGVSTQCEEHKVERIGTVVGDTAGTSSDSASAEGSGDADAAGNSLTISQTEKIAGVSYVRKYQAAQRLTHTDHDDDNQ